MGLTFVLEVALVVLTSHVISMCTTATYMCILCYMYILCSDMQILNIIKI